MAQFLVEIPDDQVATVVTALCRRYGYAASVDDPAAPGQAVPNPESPNQFANRVVRNFIKETVEADAVDQARSAIEAARQSVAGITITDPTGLAP